MQALPHLIFTVTNDLNYDQRMQRICNTLAQNGYRVTLVGRLLPHSQPLLPQAFQQKRLRCYAQKGPLFYAEYNLRLFFFLLFASCDAICSIDLDSLPAGCLVSVLRRKKRVFDAHEHFTEVPEVTERKQVKALWEMIARRCLPFYKHAYTVGHGLADLFEKKYGLPFAVVRNVPLLQALDMPSREKPFILLYQGALNEGRGIETAIDALPFLPELHLWLAGEGDLSEALRQRAARLNIQDRLRFLGYVRPGDLPMYTRQAWVGINLLENKGLSYYYSLANKFFDYVQTTVPVITMNFPEYRALNSEWEVAILLDDLQVQTLVSAVQKLMAEPASYHRLQQNCLEARKYWNWQAEEQILLDVWENACKRSGKERVDRQNA